ETLNGYYHVLNQILTKQGIPLAFLTDKRTVFEYTSKAMKAVEGKPDEINRIESRKFFLYDKTILIRRRNFCYAKTTPSHHRPRLT
ncbi:hypothetical protein, partial [Desemzia sp. FAM 23991]|uniref:hypothetical protein n=1 Tax=unclassified Desemzia TaxID=2685243 RepID=UPI003887E2C5